jgi:hypothetical protein
VKENWRESPAILESLDWRKQLEDLAEREATGNDDERMKRGGKG